MSFIYAIYEVAGKYILDIHACQTTKLSKLSKTSSAQLTCIRVVVIVSGMQLTIRQHHPPQRAVLSQICCFGERKVVSDAV